MAKAAPWTKTDAQVRKRGEQTG
ncbi:hypothetical protein SK82_02220, partial [Escherichia coli]